MHSLHRQALRVIGEIEDVTPTETIGSHSGLDYFLFADDPALRVMNPTGKS
jgi:hypothetical protein